jgi:hypothetical protein
MPTIIEGGQSIIDSLVTGVTNVLGSITDIGNTIINTLMDVLSGVYDSMVGIGEDIINGIIGGLNNKNSSLINSMSSIGNSLLKSTKKALGIASPSKLFRDQVGKNLALGIGEGFSDEMRVVSKEMQNDIPILDAGGAVGNVSTTGAGAFNYSAMVSAFKEALGQMTVELDDRQVGKFVQKTVSNAIYTV